MRKLLAAILFMAGVAMAAAQNPTIINVATNQGVQQYPSNRHTGVVTLGLNTNGAVQYYVLSWTNNTVVWLPATNATSGAFLLRNGPDTFNAALGPLTVAGYLGVTNGINNYGAFTNGGNFISSNGQYKVTLLGNAATTFATITNSYVINQNNGNQLVLTFASNDVGVAMMRIGLSASPSINMSASGTGSITFGLGASANSAGSGGILFYSGGPTLLGYFGNSVAGMYALNGGFETNVTVGRNLSVSNWLSTVAGTTNLGPFVSAGPQSTPTAGQVYTNNAVQLYSAMLNLLAGFTNSGTATFNGPMGFVGQGTNTSSLVFNTNTMFMCAGTAIVSATQPWVFASLFNSTYKIEIASTAIDANITGGDTSTGFMLKRTGLDKIQIFVTGITNKVDTTIAASLYVRTNAVVRGQAVMVSSLSTASNSFAQFISGNVVGTTSITFATAFTSVPKIFLSHADAGGTAILNDNFWYTNATTTGCVVGTRTAAGVASSTSLAYDLMAVGNQ